MQNNQLFHIRKNNQEKNHELCQIHKMFDAKPVTENLPYNE